VSFGDLMTAALLTISEGEFKNNLWEKTLDRLAFMDTDYAVELLESELHNSSVYTFQLGDKISVLYD